VNTRHKEGTGGCGVVTFSCDKPHRLRTVDEKTLAEKMFDEWWEKDREG
jgi:hypothetical protein